MGPKKKYQMQCLSNEAIDQGKKEEAEEKVI